MKRLVIRSAAREDILDYFDYVSDQGAPQAAARFLHAAQVALERIQQMPGIGSPRELDDSQLAGLRSVGVPGFEVVRFYYLETEDTIRVLHLLHGSRDVKSLLANENPEGNSG